MKSRETVNLTESQTVEQAAQLLALKIPAECFSRATDNFAAIARIAALGIEFELCAPNEPPSES